MMTLHKLSAGDGYTYLTRQVASADVARPAGQSLADYYTAAGNPPGRWLGSGAQLLGLAGRPVTEAQMRSLFGEGRHPDAERIVADHLAAGAPPAAAQRAARLGRPFPHYVPLAGRVRRRLAALDHPATDEEAERIRAEEARRERRPVAGYDLVFTPVKSASLLWALADADTRRQVEAAHHEAVADVLGFLEQHAAFTRVGDGGIAQVDTHGLVAAAFDHRDSRLGDPDLHTHVAVSNKVRAREDGPGGAPRWLALDGKALYAVGVAASERYNTRFEDALARRLGVHFAERAGAGRGKRPVREVAGVPLELVRAFSRRRTEIEDRYRALAADYRARHGREPSRTTQVALAQQATLETRQGKPAPRAFAEQLAGWRAQAAAVVGEPAVAALTARACGRAVRYVDPADVDVDALARTVVATVERERSTWTRWHVAAEAERATRALRPRSAAERNRLVDAVIDRATSPDLAIRIAAPVLADGELRLRRRDGDSVFHPHGCDRYTTPGVLAAEQELLAAAAEATGQAVDAQISDLVLDHVQRRDERRLDEGQAGLARAFTGQDRRLLVAIGPAGAGKTTALRAAVAVWQAVGVRVVPLASSAAAADVLGGELGLRAENLHKFLHELDTARDAPSGADRFYRLGAGDVVLVDEAGMAGTLQLARVLRHARAVGALVRLVGDPYQLTAVEAGGALRLLARQAGAVELDQLHRFADRDEAAATLHLRRGDPAALGFYEARDRIRSGAADAMTDAAFAAWRQDMLAGRHAVLATTTSDGVAELAARARLDRVALGAVEIDGVPLADGTTAGRGDWVLTRANDRRLSVLGGRDFVKNGDTWQVLARSPDGALTVEHLTHRGRTTLPAAYVAESVDLAYATTAHRAQGMTTDTAHAVVTPGTSREALYVLATRARERTHLYVATDQLIDVAAEHAPPMPQTAREVLTAVLATETAERSATETIRHALTAADGAATAQTRYATQTCDSAAAERLIRASLPDARALQVLRDPAWPILARTVSELARRGWDVPTALRTAVELEEGNGSSAEDLTTRLHRQTSRPSHDAPAARPRSDLPDARRLARRPGSSVDAGRGGRRW